MKDDWINIEADKNHIKKEKAKAKELRKKNWWKNLIQKGTCHYCHKKFKPTVLTMDHIVPLARGGKSTKGNIVVACKECNSQKKYLTPVDLFLKRDQIQ